MAKIVIIDDSETLRGQIRRDLESVGHTVVEGTDGMHGLEVIHATPDAQLVICDVNMPRLDGLSMCVKLFELRGGPSIPIFMLTTECSPEMKTKGKTVGVVAWITKPYTVQKLLTAVDKITATAKAA